LPLSKEIETLDRMVVSGLKFESLRNIHRVPGFLSSRPNRAPAPHPQASVASPLWVQGEGDTLACVGRGWGPNFDAVTDTLVLYVYSTTV
jgi:hypothetical protein